MGRHPKDLQMAKRRADVSQLHLKGFENCEIASKLGCSEKVVRDDINYMNKLFDQRITKSLEYRKKKNLAKITLVEQTAWEIFDNDDYKNPTTKLSAHRVILTALELEAKVDGLVQEKLVSGVDQAAQKLMHKLHEIETGAKKEQSEQGGNGHKEVGVINA